MIPLNDITTHLLNKKTFKSIQIYLTWKIAS